MESDQSLVRAVRLARIPHYLHCHPQGLTAKELAGLCGVSARTIQRDINSLQHDLKIPVTQENNRYGILGDYILPPVAFSLYEAVALFLASRLALRQTDENNPYMHQALVKVSDVLPSPVAEHLKSGIEIIAAKKSNPHFLKVFESVAVAWITQRQLRIEYLSLGSQTTKEWVLDPYFVEMTGIGYSIYVIGQAVREGKEGITTFKLDRIKKAELTANSFEIPPDMDIEKQLAFSWGVVWGEDIDIELKFSPNVTRRVKESIWHPSQIITDLPDGSCLLKLRIGSLMEITPWIRSWGPDVEVMEPQTLRDEFKRWAEQAHTMYHNQ